MSANITIIDRIFSLAVFWGLWAYAVASFGWLLGGALGWIPALIASIVLCPVFYYAKPLIAVAMCVGVIAYQMGLV